MFQHIALESPITEKPLASNKGRRCVVCVSIIAYDEKRTANRNTMRKVICLTSRQFEYANSANSSYTENLCVFETEN